MLGEFGTAPIEIGVAALSQEAVAPQIKFDKELGLYVPETGHARDMEAADKAKYRYS